MCIKTHILTKPEHKVVFFSFYFYEATSVLGICSLPQGTLQPFVIWTQRITRLGKIICGSHKMSHAGIASTILDDVKDLNHTLSVQSIP